MFHSRNVAKLSSLMPIFFATTLVFILLTPFSAVAGNERLSAELSDTFQDVEETITLPFDPMVHEMLGLILTDTVIGYTRGLSGEDSVLIGGSPYTIATRYSRTDVPISKATQFVYEHFQALGLPVQYHSYYLPDNGTRRNVIAEQAGELVPSCIYIIGAHLDDTAESAYRYTLAPGADDNASGSTAVLVAADILSQYDFTCTIRYVLFTGEEQGLYGSLAYASEIKMNGDNVQGYLNLDMISYNSDSFPIVDIHTRLNQRFDLAIANVFVGVVQTYDLDLTPEIRQDGMEYSDHASFWDQDYPAVLAIEDWDDETPYYHTIGDRVQTLDEDYYHNFVKAAVGSIAVMAGPIHETVYSRYLPLVYAIWGN